MATTIFPVTEIEEKDGFTFVIVPEDDTDEEQIQLCEQASKLLNGTDWENTHSQLTVDVLTSTDSEDGDLLYLDAVEILREAEHPWAEDFYITSAVVIDNQAIITAGFNAGDNEEDTLLADESEFD